MGQRKTRSSFFICGCMRNLEGCVGYFRHYFGDFHDADLKHPSDVPVGV